MQSHSDREFTKLAGDYLDDRSARHPDAATELGDHRFDAQLPRPFGGRARRRTPGAGSVGARGRHAGHFRAGRRTPGRRGDDGERRGAADIRAGRAARAYLESAARQSGPGHLCPAGPGLRPATGPARLGRGRLAAVPAALAAARQLLGPMPRVHLETAITQFSGTITLVTEVVDAALRDAPGRERRHRDGTPGGSAGAGRAPRMAVRTARRGRRAVTGSRTRGPAPSCSPGSCRSP